jgi:hypothetical protein
MVFNYDGNCNCASIRAFRMAAKAMDWSDCEIRILDKFMPDGKTGHQAVGSPDGAVRVFIVMHDYFLNEAMKGFISDIVDGLAGFEPMGSC